MNAWLRMLKQIGTVLISGSGMERDRRHETEGPDPYRIQAFGLLRRFEASGAMGLAPHLEG
jgi:hypothetical protein